jgi:hypothetical protein
MPRGATCPITVTNPAPPVLQTLVTGQDRPRPLKARSVKLLGVLSTTDSRFHELVSVQPTRPLKPTPCRCMVSRRAVPLRTGSRPASPPGNDSAVGGTEAGCWSRVRWRQLSLPSARAALPSDTQWPTATPRLGIVWDRLDSMAALRASALSGRHDDVRPL